MDYIKLPNPRYIISKTFNRCIRFSALDLSADIASHFVGGWVYYSSLVYRYAYIGFLLLVWWPIMKVFILLCYIVGIFNESEKVYYAHELTFHSSFALFLVRSLMALIRCVGR